jgi:hypothetical protein
LAVGHNWRIIPAVTKLVNEKNIGFMWVPSGYVNSLLLKMTIEIRDVPIKHGDFP